MINDLNRHKIDIRDELLDAVTRVIDSGWYVLGPECTAFEEKFADYCGVNHAVGLASGTDALELALRAVNVTPGDHVITVANAGMYSTTAILAVAAEPIYIDVDPETLLISLEHLSETNLRDVSAIIVTHLFGKMVDMSRIMDIAKSYNIPVIEDCAQAHGAIFNNRRSGSWGDISCFSFYPTKNLGALGDGGAIVTDNDELARKVRQLRQYGWERKYYSTLLGGRNSRLDELQAAVLRVKLRYLDSWNKRRREIAKLYGSCIAHSAIRTPSGLDESYVGHLYVIRCAQRDELQRYLKNNKVATDIHYPYPDYQQPILAQRFSDLLLLETERACKEVLTLPCFPEMTDDEVVEIAEVINQWKV